MGGEKEKETERKEGGEKKNDGRRRDKKKKKQKEEGGKEEEERKTEVSGLKKGSFLCAMNHPSSIRLYFGRIIAGGVVGFGSLRFY